MSDGLGYDRIGSGPPIVLLHPLGADRHVWDGVALAMAAEREVITVDLPGFGSSPALAETPTPAALAAAVDRFLTEAGVVRPDVAGNSLGGWIALELGLSASVRSVTAIAPAGLWSRPLGPRRNLAHALARVGRPLIRPATASSAGRRLLLAGSVAHPERVSAQAAAHLIRAYGAAPDFVRVNAQMRRGFFTQLGDIEVPVTLVWPEHDGLIARPRILPTRVRNVDLPDAGHIPMLDQPDQVAALLADTAGAGRVTDGLQSAQPPAAR